MNNDYYVSVLNDKVLFIASELERIKSLVIGHEFDTARVVLLDVATNCSKAKQLANRIADEQQ